MASGKGVIVLLVMLSVGLMFAAAIVPDAIGTISNSTATGGTLDNSNVSASTITLWGLLGLIAVVVIILAFLGMVGRSR